MKNTIIFGMMCLLMVSFVSANLEDGMFVAVGWSGAVRWSEDGKNWTDTGTAGGTNLYGIAWSPELGLFAAVGSSGAVRWSEDGKVWTTSGTAGSHPLNGVAWSPELGLFVAVGQSGHVRWSDDGKNWTTTGTAGSVFLSSVVWSPEFGLFVAVGGCDLSEECAGVRWSEDGKNWTTTGSAGQPGEYESLLSVAYSPELEIFTAVGDDSVVRWSEDGKNWTTEGTAGSNGFKGVAWSSELGLFTAVGDNGAVLWSDDGKTWTETGTAGSGHLHGIAWSPELGLFTAVGNSGQVRWSDDGKNWTDTGTAGSSHFRGVAWGKLSSDPPTNITFNPFISKWKTDNLGTSNSDQITLPLVESGSYNFFVDWGDGNNDTITSWNQSEVTHTYPSAGTYTINITGVIEGWSFNNDGDKEKILEISKWGDLRLGNTGGYFYGASNLEITADDVLDTSGTTDMSYAFADTIFSRVLHEDVPYINEWDMSNVTNMSNMFAGNPDFNMNISAWDVSKVTDMSRMFYLARSYGASFPNNYYHVLTDGFTSIHTANAMSKDDGQTMIISSNSRLYLSIDGGTTWNEVQPAGNDNRDWRSADINDDGNTIIAAAWGSNGRIYISHDRGQTWFVGSANNFWNHVSVSGDGQTMVAGYSYSSLSRGKLYLSIDGGDTWDEIQPSGPTDRRWMSSSINTDGQVIFVSSTLSSSYGRVFRSTDRGQNWTEVFPSMGEYNANQNWQTVSVSGDGQKVLAGINHQTGRLWFSSDGGDNWTQAVSGVRHYLSSGISKDGTALFASGTTNVYISTDGGNTWSRTMPTGVSITGNWVGSIFSSGNFVALLLSDTINNDLYLAYEKIGIDINNWNVSSVTNMNEMFRESYYNQPMDDWDVSNVENMGGLFQGALNFAYPLDNWNTSKVTNMSRMFMQTQFNNPVDHFDVSQVTDLSDMFNGISAFNRPVTSWNTSKVTNMRGLFMQTSFNQPVDHFDVSQVTDLSDMFRGISAFNRPVTSWNTSNVEDMAGLFRQTSFNQNINHWNTSKVTNMSYMFNINTFNQPLNDWDVSNVKDMSYMFSHSGTTVNSFNQPLNNWDVSNVENMEGMFYGTWIFNQDIYMWDTGKVKNMRLMFSTPATEPGLMHRFTRLIGNWNTSSLEDVYRMFYNNWGVSGSLSGWAISQMTNMEEFMQGTHICYVFSVDNYDETLISWASQAPNINNEVVFDPCSSRYCRGGLARDVLINDYNWTINDGGEWSGCPPYGVELNSPTNGTILLRQLNATLNVTVTFKGEGANLSFYWANDTLIQTIIGVSEDDVVTTFVDDLTPKQEYCWYVTTDGGEYGFLQTENWCFIPNNEPVIEIYSPSSLDNYIATNEEIEFIIIASDPYNHTLTYSWYINGSDQGVSNNNLLVNGSLGRDYYLVRGEVTDGYDIVYVEWGLTIYNSQPVITNYTPTAYNVMITPDDNIIFTVTAMDIDGDILSYEWYVNGTAQNHNETSITLNGSIGLGEYSVLLVVSDGLLNESISWHLTIAETIVESLGHYRPIDTVGRAEFVKKQCYVDINPSLVYINDDNLIVAVSYRNREDFNYLPRISMVGEQQPTRVKVYVDPSTAIAGGRGSFNIGFDNDMFIKFPYVNEVMITLSNDLCEDIYLPVSINITNSRKVNEVLGTPYTIKNVSEKLLTVDGLLIAASIVLVIYLLNSYVAKKPVKKKKIMI